MNLESRSIDLPCLKALIRNGIQAIPNDMENQQAVIVIGDTGVGKSTIMSFLSGSQLMIKFDGIKATLDTLGQSKIKIGHDKYSETSIPTKVVIDSMAFYDCPGFKDNKGQQYEISNSFFVQRLLDLYSKVKIILIVDESHISQARADKLPKLLKNLLQAFGSFQDIQDGVCLIINRAGRDNTEQDYQQELLGMSKLKNQSGPLFDQNCRQFINYLLTNKRVILFKQANKKQTGKVFAEQDKRRILNRIKQMSYVKTHHIQNIISENAKLAIRDFIDEITLQSNKKIQKICGVIMQIYSEQINQIGRNSTEIMKLKQQVRRLADDIQSSRKQNIVNILHSEVPDQQIQDFEQDFSSVLFFKQIYDRTDTYFSNLVNKIFSELSSLLTMLDRTIAQIQRQNQLQQQRERLRIQQQIRLQQQRQQILRIQLQEQERRIIQQQRRRIQQEQRRQREIKQRQEERRVEKIRQEQQRKIKRQEKQKADREQIQRRRRQVREREQKQKQERQRKHQETMQNYQRQQRQLSNHHSSNNQGNRQQYDGYNRNGQSYENDRNQLTQSSTNHHRQYTNQETNNLSRSTHDQYYENNQNTDKKPSLLEEIKKAMQSLKGIEGELKKVKLDAINLHNLNQEIGSEFVRIQQKYFSKPSKF